jgi:hypothetical protein
MMPGVALRTEQIADLAFMMANDRCMLLHDPGTGKTPPVCVYFWYLWDRLKERSLWTMPKSLLQKNYDELLRFTDFTPDDIVIVDGTPKQRAAQMQCDGKVFLMGFTRYAEDWTTLLDLHKDINCTIVDEFHLGFSTHKSKRTQALYASMRRIKKFVIMTGTLIKGRLNSAYPAIQIIEPRYYGSYYTFMAQHANTDEWGKILSWKNHEKLSKIFAMHGVRRSFEETYGKEAKVIIPELCDMAPDHRKLYDEWHDKALLELEEEFLSASHGGVHAIRARQIMQHPESFGFTVSELGKDERLMVQMDDAINNNEAFAIFSALIPEQERIYELLKKKGMSVALLNGGTKGADRAKIDGRFTSRQLQGLICSWEVAGIGFNWGHMDHVISLSMQYTDDAFVQAYRRGIRGVRTKPLRISLYQYRNSIDQRIAEIVEDKSRDSNKVDDRVEVLSLRAQPEPKKAAPTAPTRLSMQTLI